MVKRFSDAGRMAWAFFYWNARKTLFVLGRRRGICPCQNPSDSGLPLRTGCEAVQSWHEPARFARVCPLLARANDGRWVCRVMASEVRPFWGRAFVAGLGVALPLILVVGVALFAVMHGIGYDVTVRQVFWPPAWSELREVRSRLFFQQAQDFFAEGRMREVMAALSSAQAVNPHDFESGLLLARFYEAGNPAFADVLYGRLLNEHPLRRAEIARNWLPSLLARNQLEQVARLARQRLASSPGAEEGVWTHALIFSAQQFVRPEWLDKAVANARVRPAPRGTLALAAKLARETDGAKRQALLRQTPLEHGFAYDRIFRIERLLAEGLAHDALQLLAVSRDQLTDRDVARLALAAYAVAGDEVRLDREFAAMLAPGRAVSAAELNLLALHLVVYPSPTRLDQVVAALPRLSETDAAARVEAALAVYCAAGVQANAAHLRTARQVMEISLTTKLRLLDRLEDYFLKGPRPQLPLENILTEVRPLSLELTYALSSRYFSGPPQK